MTSHDDIRLSPGPGGALLMCSYELRGRDGKRVCTVARGDAELGLSDGRLELWNGRHGAYLRSVALSYPDGPRHVDTDSGSMHQPGQAPKGAIRPMVDNKRRPASGWVGSFRARRIGTGHATPAA